MSKAQAQNIAQALGDGVAPTPQNTPLQATPGGMSRPHVPTTIGEDSEGEEEIPTISSNNIRDQLAGNPMLAAMVQGKLANLIGKSSGYIESLSPIVRQRVDGLKGLQLEHTKLEAEFQREILELEKRFAEKYRPIYERRRAIVEGKEEPTEEEIKAGYKADLDNDVDEDDEDAPPAEREIVSAEEAAKGEKGIPGFWLTALSNHAGISELITERDEEALKYLVDVRVEYLGEGKPGFKLLFEFDPQAKEFFEDTILSKTYFYQEEVGSLGDFIYDHAEGTEIKWKTGKDLTVKVETKKQRNKNTNQTRTVKKVVPTDSFFNFFKPPTPSGDDDESNEDDDIDEKLELDYQIGEDIKDRIVPHAIDYFTGKALEQDMDDDFESDEFDEDDFEDEDDDDEDDDDADVPAGGRAIKGATGRKAAQPPQSGVTPGSAQDPQECKNQ